MKKFSLTVLYDNKTLDGSLSPAHGFACVIRIGEKNILFDTGGKADILLSNMEKLNIDPKEITDIFVSHIHWDHTGGLFGFLAQNNKVRVIVPDSFSAAYKGEIRASGAEVLGVKNFETIAEGLYSTGEMGKAITEQALIIDRSEDLVMITGCAHPGVIDIIKKAKTNINKPVRLVLGGFHLSDKDQKEIEKIIGEFRTHGVEHAAPCHCTGEKAIELFQKEYGNDYIQIGVGKTIGGAK